MPNAVHHIELWTQDLARSEPSFHWLLTELGWRLEDNPDWPDGRSWTHSSGAYLCLEQSPAVTGPQDRMHAGLNHLALWASDRDHLDELRRAAPGRGWRELFAERYPHAGGPDYTALYLENDEGFELEIVIPQNGNSTPPQ